MGEELGRKAISEKLQFPRISRIALEAFSLFSQRPDVAISIPPGVVCLAGANGIGKSTFLSAINFALTGAVPPPDRKYMSAGEYIKAAKRFTAEFFTGRISEAARERASITVEFQIGDIEVIITRGIFEPDELRCFRVKQPGGESAEPSDFESQFERDQEYKQFITKKIGLRSFDQFVFLQHLVLTFDESRHLLLWDERALDAALHLCFGAGPEDAEKAENLRREMDKADSLGRNYQFQANNIKKQILIFKKSLKNPEETESEDSLKKQFDQMYKELDELRHNLEVKSLSIGDAEVKISTLSSDVSRLSNTYSTLFSSQMSSCVSIDKHPLIARILEEKVCSVCGGAGERIAQGVLQKISHKECPCCGSTLEKTEAQVDAFYEQAQEIDRQLASLKQELSDAFAEKSRVEKEIFILTEEIAAKDKTISSFLSENPDISMSSPENIADNQLIQRQIGHLESAYQSALASKQKQFDARDLKKGELTEIQRQVEKSYHAAEDLFLPTYKHLAKMFLGVDLDIRLEKRAVSGLALALDVKSSARREHHQLSESQRFFLDIALRMAIAKFISSERSPASMFIDTPEGSLDIAYENRAGKMFAEFAKQKHNIIMTANINSSELLKELASECRSSLMKLVRMTDWADLSEVQVESEELFQSAYNEIEKHIKASQ